MRGQPEIVIRAKLLSDQAVRQARRFADTLRKRLRSELLNVNRVTDRVRRSVKRLGDSVQALGRAGRAGLGILARGVAAVGAAATAAAAGTIALTKAAADDAFEIQRWSHVTGIASETLESLDSRVRALGGDIDVLTEAQIAAADKAVAALIQGGDAVVDFQREFNLNAAEFLELSPDKQLTEMAVALENTESPMHRAAIASALFGDEAVKLLPLFEDIANDGLGSIQREAEKTGAVLSQEERGALLGFRQSWNDITESLRIFRNQLTARAAPAITKFLDFVRTRFIPQLSGKLLPLFEQLTNKANAFFGAVELSDEDLAIRYSYGLEPQDVKSPAQQVYEEILGGFRTIFQATQGDPASQERIGMWIRNTVLTAARLAGDVIGRIGFWVDLAWAFWSGLTAGIGRGIRGGGGGAGEPSRDIMDTILGVLGLAGLLLLRRPAIIAKLMLPVGQALARGLVTAITLGARGLVSGAIVAPIIGALNIALGSARFVVLATGALTGALATAIAASGRWLDDSAKGFGARVSAFVNRAILTPLQSGRIFIARNFDLLLRQFTGRVNQLVAAGNQALGAEVAEGISQANRRGIAAALPAMRDAAKTLVTRVYDAVSVAAKATRAPALGQRIANEISDDLNKANVRGAAGLIARVTTAIDDAIRAMRLSLSGLGRTISAALDDAFNAVRAPAAGIMRAITTALDDAIRALRIPSFASLTSRLSGRLTQALIGGLTAFAVSFREQLAGIDLPSIIADFLDRLDMSKARRAFESALIRAMGADLNFRNLLRPITAGIGAAIRSLLDDFRVGGLSAAVKRLVNRAVVGVTGLADDIASGARAIAAGVVRAIMDSFDNIKLGGGTLAKGLTGAFAGAMRRVFSRANVVNLLKGFVAGFIVEWIINKLVEAFTGDEGLSAFLYRVLPEWAHTWDGLFAKAREQWYGFIGELAGILRDLEASIVDSLTATGAFLLETITNWEPTFALYTSAFREAKDTIVLAALNLFQQVRDRFTRIGDVLTSAKDTWSSILNGIVGVWKDFKSKFKSAVQSVVNAVAPLLRQITSMLTRAQSAYNTIRSVASKAESIASGIGSGIGNIVNVVTAPFKADGGIATRPQTVVVAEGGSSEAIIPLNRQGVAVLAKALEAAGAGAGAGNIEVHVHLEGAMQEQAIWKIVNRGTEVGALAGG